MPHIIGTKRFNPNWLIIPTFRTSCMTNKQEQKVWKGSMNVNLFSLVLNGLSMLSKRNQSLQGQECEYIGHFFFLFFF